MLLHCDVHVGAKTVGRSWKGKVKGKKKPSKTTYINRFRNKKKPERRA